MKKPSIGFDPVKEEVDGKKAKSIIWTSKALELAMSGLEKGRRLVANPFYENNIKLLKGDLVFQRTPEEIEEWKLCRNDILHFAESHCKLMTPEGIQRITLRPYQERYLKHLTNSQLSIYLSCRQSGKTTTSAIYLLHYACFNIDKNTLVLGNKRKTAIEILDKIKKIYLELPFYLKPGIYKWNESEIVFDNGCRIMAEATTINSGIGFTFHCVLADEFAHVPPNILDSFYNNLFPTITAGKAKFIITSTQNGYNLFYRLYKSAEAGENDYKPFKTDWWEVPEWDPDNHIWVERDEVWHQRQVANYGSEEAFNKQFGTNFDVSANTLINNKTLAKKQREFIEYINKDLLGVPNSDHYFWLPEFDPMTDLKTSYVITTADLAEGGGGDYTAIPISRMINPGTDDLEVVGYFLCNSLKREEVAYSLQTLYILYINCEQSLLSFEQNTYGDLFLRCLLDNTDRDSKFAEFDRSVIIKYYNDTMTKFRYGIKITSSNKKTGCMLFKESYEQNNIIFNDIKFVNQLMNFTDKDGNGRYEASYGHDDLVMAVVQLEFVKQTIQYKNLRNEFNSSITVVKDEYGMNDFLDQMNQVSIDNYIQSYSYPGRIPQLFDPITMQIMEDDSQYNTYNRLNKFTNQNYG